MLTQALCFHSLLLYFALEAEVSRTKTKPQRPGNKTATVIPPAVDCKHFSQDQL